MKNTTSIYKRFLILLPIIILQLSCEATGGFGENGYIITDIEQGDNVAVDLLLQPDGKLLAVGRVNLNNYQISLARFTQEGNLDEEFGSGGLVYPDFPSTSEDATSGAIQPDGKIVV